LDTLHLELLAAYLLFLLLGIVQTGGALVAMMIQSVRHVGILPFLNLMVVALT
jgi:hypothetical protein